MMRTMGGGSSDGTDARDVAGDVGGASEDENDDDGWLGAIGWMQGCCRGSLVRKVC